MILSSLSVQPNLSLAEKTVDIIAFVADKDVFMTEIIVRRYGFMATTAKRYLRRLAGFGYLKALGGNKNRTYKFVEEEPK